MLFYIVRKKVSNDAIQNRKDESQLWKHAGFLYWEWLGGETGDEI